MEMLMEPDMGILIEVGIPIAAATGMIIDMVMGIPIKAAMGMLMETLMGDTGGEGC